MTCHWVTDFCSELPSAPPWHGNCCAFVLCIHMVSLFKHSRFWTCFTFPSLLRLQFSLFRAKISCHLNSSKVSAFLVDRTKWLICKNSYKNTLGIALDCTSLLHDEFGIFFPLYGDYVIGFQKKDSWYEVITFIVSSSSYLNSSIAWRAYTIHLSAAVRQWLMRCFTSPYSFMGFESEA